MFRKLTSHLNSYTFSLWNKEGNKAFKIKKEGCPNLWCWSQKQEESGARKPEHKSWRIEEEKNQTILKAQTKRRSNRKKKRKEEERLDLLHWLLVKRNKTKTGEGEGKKKRKRRRIYSTMSFHPIASPSSDQVWREERREEEHEHDWREKKKSFDPPPCNDHDWPRKENTHQWVISFHLIYIEFWEIRFL